MEHFHDFEQEVATHPEIARCTFLTVEEGRPSGWARMIRENPKWASSATTSSCLRARQGIRKAPVTGDPAAAESERRASRTRSLTGDHPFFLSAQKNCQSAGFRETRRFVDPKWGFPQIEYEMELTSPLPTSPHERGMYVFVVVFTICAPLPLVEEGVRGWRLSCKSFQRARVRVGEDLQHFVSVAPLRRPRDRCNTHLSRSCPSAAPPVSGSSRLRSVTAPANGDCCTGTSFFSGNIPPVE